MRAPNGPRVRPVDRVRPGRQDAPRTGQQHQPGGAIASPPVPGADDPVAAAFACLGDYQGDRLADRLFPDALIRRATAVIWSASGRCTHPYMCWVASLSSS